MGLKEKKASRGKFERLRGIAGMTCGRKNRCSWRNRLTSPSIGIMDNDKAVTHNPSIVIDCRLGRPRLLAVKWRCVSDRSRYPDQKAQIRTREDTRESEC